jgi:hypothetical protein
MRRTVSLLALGSTMLLAAGGCLRNATTPPVGLGPGELPQLARQIEMPDPAPSNEQIAATPIPASLEQLEPKDYLPMSLEQAVHLALQNSLVLRDLGGTLLRTPDLAKSKYDPSVVETDPQSGIEGALSAFDAGFTTNFTNENNDRALNNIFFGGGTRQFQQTFAVWQTQVYKKSATGTQFAVKNYTQYDANNAPGNQYPGAYTTWYDIETRHPLMQGGGVNFNRVAGPNSQPGGINGVVIARINSDTALADFELGVRNFVSDVENAYWDLYFAYRDVAAKVRARDATLKTWRRIQALNEQGRSGGEAAKEAQAREQYFRFEEEAQNALQGKLIDGTRTYNGSTGGTFRGSGGVYVVERRLRLLIGLPITDGKMIRPSDEPLKARLVCNWESSLVEALSRRVELRRQRWQLERREAELEATKNFLLPRLDATARYRWRGFGQDLMSNGGTGEFNNAYSDLTSGRFQEWQAGAELHLPIGFREAFAAVRQAEALLERERAIIHEAERLVVYDLSNAISDVDRAYAVVETNLNRRIAAAEQVAAIESGEDLGTDTAQLYILLEAQRRLAEAETAYFRSLVEYQLAVKNVQLEKGTLLEYNEVHLNEGVWPGKAHQDADRREWLRGDPQPVDEPLSRLPTLRVTPPPASSQGVFPQEPMPIPSTAPGIPVE